MLNYMKKEICNECGQSVAMGTGFFTNRVVDFNEVEDRIEMGKPYPHGAFICAECNDNINVALQDIGN